MSKEFIAAFKEVQQKVHDNARQKGFWDAPRNEGEILCLVHSEISEAVEALRVGNPPDDKIPEFDGVSSELADVIIRIMDYAEGFGYRVAEALVAKTSMNQTREKMHGKKF